MRKTQIDIFTSGLVSSLFQSSALVRFSVDYNYSSFRDFYLLLIKKKIIFDAVKKKAHQKEGRTTLILSISAARG